MKDFLFNDLIDDLSNYGKDDWVTVFEDIDIENIERGTLFAVLVDKEYSKEMLEYPGWGISIGAFKPGFVHYSDEEAKYFRFGLEYPIEPLLTQRFYNNVYPTTYELSEEFRHYHNLYFDQKSSKFISVGLMSEESEIVQIEKDFVKIKRKPLKQFLSAKNMNLVLLFDVFRYTSKDIKHFKVTVRDEFEHKDPTCQYILNFQKSSFLSNDPLNKYNSRLLGKKIISGFKDFKPKSDFDIVHDRQFVEFIIQEDEEGNTVTSTSDPNKLSYKPLNRDSGHFLSPIFFKKDVLKKYYDTPDRFAVEDGNLRCKGSWRLDIDNNQKDYVIVYLGDLGRNLSFEEQLYWRSFNVVPDGSVSKVKFYRDFLNKIHPPEAADLLFKRKFDKFQNLWAEKYGYTLFLILTSDDLYHYSYLHTPLSNNRVEFEQMILSLSKILCDSINEKQIEREQPSCKEIKGKIHKLEHYLRLTDFPEINSICFLNELQMIRSLSVAHRKGKDYVKLFEKLKFEERTFQDVFNDILMRATKFLEYLIVHLSNSPSIKI